MKSKAPQLHLEYRFYKLLGTHGESYFHICTVLYVQRGILRNAIEGA